MNTPPQSIASILEDAAKLIEPEGAWTQGDFARNAKGEPTGLSEYRGAAVCWCIAGAIAKVAADPHGDRAADVFLSKFLRIDIDVWNDQPHRTQAEVVAKLKSAAALAREQGK